MNKHTNTNTKTHKHTHTQTPTHTHTHTDTHTHTQTKTHRYIAYKHSHKHTQIHTHLNIHTHWINTNNYKDRNIKTLISTQLDTYRHANTIAITQIHKYTYKHSFITYSNTHTKKQKYK